MIQWGLPDDVSVPGDYDGDGKSDLAVYRPPTGLWYLLKSSTSFSKYSTTVPGDYDGDGKTDMAVHRPANGVWYVLKSNSGFTTSTATQWGLPGDVPIFKRQ
jgi:hypothetical protein